LFLGKVLQFILASFKWKENSKRDTIRNIHFSVKQGELVAVVGAEGSGKVFSPTPPTLFTTHTWKVSF
jgi:ABC-type multidrug transport system fused ATPase/permease subunit